VLLRVRNRQAFDLKQITARGVQMLLHPIAQVSLNYAIGTIGEGISTLVRGAPVWEIRELCLLLLLDPVYDLWERLFLLGMFCKKLSGLIEDGCFDQIPLLLHDYAQLAIEGKLRDDMDGVPIRLEAQVAMLLETANSFFATRGPKQYRLHECLRDFLDGLHHTEAPEIESCLGHYADGYARYYKPFMQRHPYLLENHLVNHVFRARFPFSKGDPCLRTP
jgi:lysine-N-methylase